MQCYDTASGSCAPWARTLSRFPCGEAMLGVETSARKHISAASYRHNVHKALFGHGDPSRCRDSWLWRGGWYRHVTSSRDSHSHAAPRRATPARRIDSLARSLALLSGCQCSSAPGEPLPLAFITVRETACERGDVGSFFPEADCPGVSQLAGQEMLQSVVPCLQSARRPVSATSKEPPLHVVPVNSITHALLAWPCDTLHQYHLVAEQPGSGVADFSFIGATVAQRLACSPPTKTIRVQYPAIPDFRMWESYWTMLFVGGFSRGSPVSTAPSFCRCSVLTSMPSITDTRLHHWFHYDYGDSLLCVATRVGRFVATVVRCWNQWVREDDTHSLREDSSRPRQTTPREDRCIVCQAMHNPMTSAAPVSRTQLTGHSTTSRVVPHHDWATSINQTIGSPSCS
ncbi:hypothetical protein PR048_008656 [Dryococelus australis]|uniref:Uncharacterized protein n=1 Tax=Dryococelus australis TaxID=614101 RepID=A0ABQ9HY11_9NEOP|nr:hypothetical protein PR048_008656 [Dryococelus australis]